jgi:DNA-directed RNA polymerase specialized sigma subunit
MVSANPNDFHVMVNPRSQSAESVAKWIGDKMANNTDPASRTPGAPPMYGEDAVPHLMTFQSIVGSFSRAYINPDEAMRDSIDNAHLMEKDVGLLESVECRQRLTALLDWEIVPEDEKCQYQVSLAQELQKIIGRIRNFTKYRMWLMKAIWSGRSGIQHKYGYTRVNGSMRMMPTPLHRDHNGWMPINGDKLIFRYEDGLHTSDAGAYPHQMGIKVGVNPGGGKLRIHRDYKTEPVADGMAVFLKPYERDTFCVHKHMIEDADFHHSYFAGSIHGVGIRSKIYWEWFLKQEAFAFLMQYLERSAGGIEVWTYPMGDPKALEATKKAAMEKMANGRNIVFFPKPMGDDSDAYKFEVIEPGAMGLDIMQGIIENYFGGRLKRYILGQELSTEAKATGMGSGVAEAHMDTLSQIVNFDARNLEETLTHELVRYIQQLNFPETLGWHMRMSLKTEDDKTQERMEALNSAYQMGARIAESEVFKTLGLSAPTSGEKILSMQSQQPGGIPGMPGMDGMDPMGGMPPGADPSADPESGVFPDQETDSEEEMSGDPMELIRSLMDQYMRERDVDRYASQLAFNFDEKLHPRESVEHGGHKPGQFAPKNTGGMAKPKQQSLFGGSAMPVARRSAGGAKKPGSGKAASRFATLFAEHMHKQHQQKTINFDEPINTPAEHPSPTQAQQPAQTPVSIETEKPPLEEMSRIAAGYQLHGMRAEPEDDRLARQHQKHMTKSALDNWLMKKFDIDAFTARGVSNAAGEMNPYTVDGSGTVGGTNVRWTHKSKEPSIEELGDVPWTQQAPTPQPQPVTQSQQTPPTADVPSQPEASPNADMPTKPARRRMMGASADSMKAVAQPTAAPITPKPQQPAPSVQSIPALKSAPGQYLSKTQEKIDTSQKPVDSGNTSQRDQLVTDHFHLVPKVVRMMQKKGWSVRDDDAAESAAMDGLMKAAEKWDGSTDFATYAKNGMAQAIKNLNRRKLDKMTSSGMSDDESDPMANVQSRDSGSVYDDEAKSHLNDAMSKLGKDSDQWLVRAWFTKEDENGNALTQDQAAEEYNNRFGTSLTRQAIAARAVKLAAKLRDSLGDPNQYAAVRNMIIRYYRDEILTMQKERYERRQDRMIREAAEYTESDPTDAQIKAGNYKKGRFTWNGMPIVIENPRGSTRRGVSSSGEIWRQEMTAHYGYISGTEGSDGDQVDVFMGKYPDSELVFVVSQIDQSTGQFDELKVILGETNLKKAKALYLSNYSKGWKCGEIEPMTISQFKAMLESGDC